MIAGSALGVGLFVLAFAVLFWKKGWAPLLVDILAVLGGLCVAGSVATLFNINAGWNLGGVGYDGVVLFFAVWFVLEFRHYGRHKTRTPVLGLITAVGLMTSSLGPASAIAQHVEQGVVTRVQNANFANVGGASGGATHATGNAKHGGKK